ncbi:hypothetical protein DPMN_010866 [Dreissena polymorpha]|uniref:Uncharacterized protein n=1 Tax=Dreissena polymorpha TaxID=45954 RepID=A0A9D4N2T7_DREPO|nr:hypothetical protein DPMN_010866 [Dreissena polymorpha]
MANNANMAREVKNLLGKDRLHPNPDRFAKDLVFLAGSERKLADELLMEMVAMANGKIKASTKAVRQATEKWLMRLASSLDVYHAYFKQWISDNVWELPQAKVSKVDQEYDSNRCRRDIRERVPTLRYVGNEVLDEESLLASNSDDDLDLGSDSGKLLESPRSSASTAYMKEQPDVNTERQCQGGVGRGLMQLVSKTTGMPINPETLSLQQGVKNAGLSRVSSPSEMSGVMPDRAEPLQRSDACVGASLLTDADRPAEKEPVQRSKESVGDSLPTDKQRPVGASLPTYKPRLVGDSLPTDKQRPVGASLPTDKPRLVGASLPTDKQRPDVEGRRQGSHQPLVVRPSTSGVSRIVAETNQEGELIITIPGKRRREDEVLGESSSVVASSGPMKRQTRKGYKPCVVPGCTGPTGFVKLHAYRYHILGVFDEHLPAFEDAVVRRRVAALRQAATWLLVKVATLDDLVKYVAMQKLLDRKDTTEITEAQRKAMDGICNFFNVMAPTMYQLDPPNCPAVLVHWKALVLMAASLQEDERKYWRDIFGAPQVSEVEATLAVGPKAVDCHFHPDRLARRLGVQTSCPVVDIWERGQVEREERVSLKGEVAVFCDPATFPSVAYIAELPSSVGVAVGIHPRLANQSQDNLDEWIGHMKHLVGKERVVGFGEIGLDLTEPEKDWHQKEHDIC